MTDQPAITLATFGTDMAVAVIGASGGIGHALSGLPSATGGRADPRLQPLGARAAAPEDRAARGCGGAPRSAARSGDRRDRHPARARARAGEELDGAALERAFRINATGPALVAKHFLPLLARDRKAAFAALSARVGSIEDNRLGGWHAYRASKAALNMLIRTLAIEMARRRPQALCVALHPGTVDTALSAPFQGGLAAEQLFPPQVAAARLLAVLDRLEAADSGRLFAWDGAAIPF